MNAQERRELVTYLAGFSQASLETYFDSVGLGDAFRRPSRGWGKEKRINESLRSAEERGDADDVLRGAASWFQSERERRRERKARPELLAELPVPSAPQDDAQRRRSDEVRAGSGYARIAYGLHPLVEQAASRYLRDGHIGVAIFEAFKAVEARVAALAASRRYGSQLMSAAFDAQNGPLRINDGTGPHDRDEQDGFKHIFMGATIGIRNPKAHGPFPDVEPARAHDYLALASLLMRRLDDVEAQSKSGGESS